jgi:Sec-independent protein translocase protein TatA
MVLFGAERLPQTAGDIGRFVEEAQRAAEELKSEEDRPSSELRVPPRWPKRQRSATQSQSQPTPLVEHTSSSATKVTLRQERVDYEVAP